MQHQPLPVTDELLRAVERDPGVQRTREFQLLGDTVESRREWLHTIGIMNQAERLATAYNAGPGRVKQWLRHLPATVEHDRFVETIPFGDARQYVQNVPSCAVIYAYLEGREASLVQPAEQLVRNPCRLRAANAG